MQFSAHACTARATHAVKGTLHGARASGRGKHRRIAPRGFQQDSIKGVHHVGMICEDLKKSLHFYKDVLGLPERDDRPDDKLPYDGAWLQLGPEMIHLMELDNPDAGMKRPEHGGRDRHFCVGVAQGSVKALTDTLDKEGIPYTQSQSGRPAIFFRDPDENTLEVVETADWR